MMEGFRRDARYALRSLLRAPGFTPVAVLTLALGIGADTAIFSVVDATLLRPLPYDEADDLVTVWLDASERGGSAREWLAPGDLQDLRREPGLFAGIGGWDGWSPTLTGAGEPTVLDAAWVTEGMFQRVLRSQPFLGRGFLAEEDAPGAAGTVVLSYSFWQERFGGDRSALGRPLILDDRPYSVVGVMPAGFRPPFLPYAELWAPAQLDPTQCGRGCNSVRAVARLAPGVSLEVARERAGAVAERVAATFPDARSRVGVSIFRLREDLVGAVSPALWTLMAAVGCVLLIACTNVAGLLLLRGKTRERELALRIVVGADRGRIVRQVLTEAVVLAAMGGTAGLLLASWGTAGLMTLAPIAPLVRVSVNGRVLAFTGALATCTGLVFGLLPAWRAGRDGGRASLARAVRPVPGGGGLRGGVVVAQVGVALILSVGAGLLIRSLADLRRSDLGFDPANVLTVDLSLPATRFVEAGDRVAFFERLRERLAALPGVISAGGTESLPLAGRDVEASFRLEDAPPASPSAPDVAWVRPVTLGYFYTMGQGLVDGREFDDGDGPGDPPVAIVNEAFARRYFDFPQGSPVGRRVALGAARSPVWRTVVGIAADTRHFGIRDAVRPALYVPYAQRPGAAMTMVLKADGDPADVAAAVRTAIADLDPSLAPSSTLPMVDRVEGTLETDRFSAGLLGAFAVLALVLAAVGLFGVVSEHAAHRTTEIGVRVALGAEDRQMLRLLMRAAVGPAAAGVTIGLVGALGLVRLLSGVVYGVSVNDPATFGFAVALLLSVALAASWVPARRLSRFDPTAVLREQ